MYAGACFASIVPAFQGIKKISSIGRRKSKTARIQNPENFGIATNGYYTAPRSAARQYCVHPVQNDVSDILYVPMFNN